MSGTEKAAGPVTPQELGDVALRIAQATSTLRILNSSDSDSDAADLGNALGLLTDYLYQCAVDLSDLHRRHSQPGETRA